MDRFCRLLDHFRNHTLLDRIQWEWRKQIRRRRLKWWRSQTGRPEYFEARIQRGVRMCLHFDSKLAQAIYCQEFELKERQFLNAFLRPGDVFVDVGANIGLFSLLAARRVGKSGKVYAFEPTTKIYERLCENVQLNQFSNILCFQLALSDERGEFPFFASQDGFDAWNSLAQPIAGDSFSVETVETTTWDTFAEKHSLVGRVTMMKVDVEGWETRVVSGASTMLSRVDAPVLQVEFTEKAARSANSSCTELYHKLQKLDYEMFAYDEKSRTLIPYPPRENYPQINLIAAKQSREAVTRIRK